MALEGDAGPKDATRTILWVHGYTMDSSIWEEVWPMLPGWRHVGIDLPGHGSSPSPRKDAFRECVAHILRSADRHGARLVAAMSFGGAAVLAAMAERPSFFRACILAAPALPGGPLDAASEACNVDLIRLAAERGIGPWLLDRWMATPPGIFDGLRAHPHRLERVRSIVAAHRWSELQAGGFRDLATARITPAQLRRIETGVTLLIGENDMPSFRRTAEIIVRSIPRSKRVFLDNLGHLVFLESPERTARIVHMEFSRVDEGI